MPYEEPTRRNFLRTASLAGLGIILFPSQAEGFSIEDREYRFQGDLNLGPISLGVHGNISFNKFGGDYHSQIKCYRSKNPLPSYAIYSECDFQNGILIPRKTITEINIDLGIWKQRRTKTLNYEMREGGLSIKVKVETYYPNEIKTSLKTRKHNFLEDNIPLDYISSALGLILGLRNGDVPEKINIISGSGKMIHQEISFEETPEGYQISAVYEYPLGKTKRHRLPSRNDAEQSRNYDQERKSSITLELDKEQELTHLVLSHKKGSLDANVERVP